MKIKTRQECEEMIEDGCYLTTGTVDRFHLYIRWTNENTLHMFHIALDRNGIVDHSSWDLDQCELKLKS